MFQTYCRALIESFYNPRVYRDAITSWQGFGGVYFMMLAAVTGAILFSAFLITLQNFDKNRLNQILDQVPSLSITDGKIYLDADVEQPFIIRDPQDQMNITIDTTKSESELRDTKTQIGIGHTFIFVQYQGQYEVFYTDKFGNAEFVINNETLRKTWDRNIPTIKTFAFPMIWLGQFVNVLFTGIIVAFLSYFLTTFMKEEFVFVTRLRLAALALTPACIISMLLRLTMAHNTAPWFSVMVALLYLYVMLMLMRRIPDAQNDDDNALIKS